jgi:hypothetical protein
MLLALVGFTLQSFPLEHSIAPLSGLITPPFGTFSPSATAGYETDE